MPSIFACFGGCSGGLVPPEHTELSRNELKALYERSIGFNNGRLIVHGIFARADTKNNNKRVYPKYILKREVAKFEQQHIVKGTALGELDHPNYASQYFKCLNLPNVSHQVLEVQWKGDQLWGTIEILPTPSGMLLWELYSQGIKLGVSSRGWASLRTDPKAKCVYVDDDFELITFDFVTEPSTRGAYLVPIRRAYRARVPDQSKAVQIAHLGHGVVSMMHVPRLPEVAALVSRINELHAQQVAEEVMAAQAAAGLTLRPPAAAAVGEGAYAGGAPAGRGHPLDKLLCHSHYVVYSQAAYLAREPHARDFASHLTMFATRAHLADQQQFLNRSDLNALILREMAKEEEEEQQHPQQAAAVAAGTSYQAVPRGPGAAAPAALQQGGYQHMAGQTRQGATGISSSQSGYNSGRSSNGQVAAQYLHPSRSIGILQHVDSMDASTSGTPTMAEQLKAHSAQQHQQQTRSQRAASLDQRDSSSRGLAQSDSAECQGVLPASDLGAWSLHPNALDIPSQPPGTGNQHQAGPGSSSSSNHGQPMALMPNAPGRPPLPPGALQQAQQAQQLHLAGVPGGYQEGVQGPGSSQSDSASLCSSQYSVSKRPPVLPYKAAPTFQPAGYGSSGGPPAPGQRNLAAAPPSMARGSNIQQAGAGQGQVAQAAAVVGRPGVGQAEAARAAQEVAEEFQRIKRTLASFGHRYTEQQGSLARMFKARLPLTADAGAPVFSLTGARL
mmetsp:Transcript_18408/g.46554  ORF Transcript_18408/g.46554 Transcript_18408/m.46554 type:complete len:728 (-) Transcript_18408:628-2811(-)